MVDVSVYFPTEIKRCLLISLCRKYSNGWSSTVQTVRIRVETAGLCGSASNQCNQLINMRLSVTGPPPHKGDGSRLATTGSSVDNRARAHFFQIRPWYHSAGRPLISYTATPGPVHLITGMECSIYNGSGHSMHLSRIPSMDNGVTAICQGRKTINTFIHQYCPLHVVRPSSYTRVGECLCVCRLRGRTNLWTHHTALT